MSVRKSTGQLTRKSFNKPYSNMDYLTKRWVISKISDPIQCLSPNLWFLHTAIVFVLYNLICCAQQGNNWINTAVQNQPWWTQWKVQDDATVLTVFLDCRLPLHCKTLPHKHLLIWTLIINTYYIQGMKMQQTRKEDKTC